MVGIGTSDVNLDKYRHTFCSLLGKDTDSWGLSYTGKIITTCCDVVLYSLLIFKRFDKTTALRTELYYICLLSLLED